MRRRAAGQRHLARPGSGRDGDGDAKGGRGGLRGAPGRAQPAAALRRGVEPHRGNPRAHVSLAEAWLAAWVKPEGFAECCTADVSYEDPLTAVPLTGGAEIDGHAALLRAALPDVAVELTAP